MSGANNAKIMQGRVGVARGINVPNAQPNAAGFATVNPIFTWVRLAQRVAQADRDLCCRESRVTPTDLLLAGSVTAHRARRVN